MKELVVSRYRADISDQSQARIANLRVDDDGLLTWADANAEQLFGYNRERFQGIPLRQLVAGSEDDPLAPAHEEALTRGQKLTLTFRHQAGHFFTGELKLGASHVDADNAASAHISLLPGDAVDRNLLSQIEAGVAIGVWELTVATNAMHWSEGIYRILDLRPGMEVTPEHALFFFQSGQARVQAALRRCLRTGRNFSFELPILTAQQRPRWVRFTGQAQHQGERVHKVSGLLVDISAEREQFEEACHWRQLLDGLADTTEDLVLAVDPELQVLMINQACRQQFEQLFGVRPQPGDDLIELLRDFPDEARLYQRLWERAIARDAFCVEMPLSQHDRDQPVYEVNFHRLTDRTGHVYGALHRAQDMSDRVGTHTNLSYVSSHDPLTGLLNRREFLLRLKRALANQPGPGRAHALLYLDLDRFEALNDEHGPGSCDRYLRALGKHLSGRIRQRDALARVGGDKLAVLLDNCDETEARKVADNLRQAIGSFTFHWRNQQLGCQASGGLIPLSGEDSARPEDMLALAADLCMTAKRAGRNRLHVYQDQESKEAQAASGEQLRALQSAINHNAIDLRFQTIRPIASATWGDYIEILSQLQLGENESLREPAYFLPIAERFDLATQYDRRVIGKTLDWLARHPLMEARLKMCSFNLSQASLLDPEFPAYFGPLLAESRYQPEIFCFEVREQDAARHPEAVEELCQGLHDLGCKVALEGVSGSGQSYNLISRMPVDVVKIDGRLMEAMASDPVRQVMVESLHRVAEVSGKITIAQYIEDDQMLKQARQLGIHFGQGFRLASPRPLDELAPPPFTESVASGAPPA